MAVNLKSLPTILKNLFLLPQKNYKEEPRFAKSYAA
jgi:hypothetical protein